MIAEIHTYIHTYIHSSPYHSSGNGLAEAAVRNMKELLKKYDGNWKKFQRGLMLWRNMPNKSGKSPAEMFLGHRQRTILPLLPGQYDFQIEDAIKAAEKRKKIRTEEYKRRRTKTLPPLKVGQKVRIQTQAGWNLQGHVTEAFNNDRSYNVITSSGAQVRRNRVMLRPVYEVESESSADEADTETGDEPDAEVVPIHDSGPAQSVSTPAEVPNPARKSTRAPIPKRPCSCCNLTVCKFLDGTS